MTTDISAKKEALPPTAMHVTQGHSCAMVDFQYCGGGLGVKDIAYMMATSVAPSLVAQEAELLQHYHTHLMAALQGRGTPCPEYTVEIMTEHYEIAMLDFVRFMAGWGWWGNTSWAGNRANSVLEKYINELTG